MQRGPILWLLQQRGGRGALHGGAACWPWWTPRPAGTTRGGAVYSVPLAASRLRVRQVPSSMPVADGSPAIRLGRHRPENGLTRIASDVV